MTEQVSSNRKRLLAEGAVIVISILLAFGIEAAWAERQDRVAEREALVSLEAEFESNHRQLRDVIEAHLSFRQTVAWFIELPESEYDALTATAPSEIVLAAANPWTFDAVRGVTDGLVGSGRLDLIRDVRLRESLSTFLNLVADLEEDVAYVASAAEAVWQREAELGGPWTDPSTEISTSGSVEGLPFIPRAGPDDLRRLHGDALYMGLVMRFHLNAAYYVRELQRLEGHVDEVLRMIRGQEEGAS